MENFNHLFDYGDIKKEHKEAAQEIANLLKNNGLEDISNEILSKFQIKEIPKYDMEGHPLLDCLKEANMVPVIQGHTREQKSDGTQMEYPMLVLCDDVRKFENLYEVIRKN